MLAGWLTNLAIAAFIFRMGKWRRMSLVATRSMDQSLG